MMQKELKNRQEFYDWYKDNDFINFTEYDTFPYIDFEEEWNQKYENDEMEYVDEDYVSEAFENSTEEAFKKGKLTYPEFFDIFTSHLMWDGYDEGKSMESEDAEIVAKDWEEYSKSLKYPLSVRDMLNIVDRAKKYKVEWKEDSITIKTGKDSVTFKKDIFSESKEKKMRKDSKRTLKESKADIVLSKKYVENNFDDVLEIVQSSKDMKKERDISKIAEEIYDYFMKDGDGTIWFPLDNRLAVCASFIDPYDGNGKNKGYVPAIAIKDINDDMPDYEWLSMPFNEEGDVYDMELVYDDWYTPSMSFSVDDVKKDIAWMIKKYDKYIENLDEIVDEVMVERDGIEECNNNKITKENKERKMRKENLKKSVKESLKMRLRKRLEESKAIKEERGNPKYITVRVLQGNYGYGWDDLVEYDMTYEGQKECKADLKAYRENEKGIPFRVIHRRIPNDKYIPKETTDEIAKDEVESVEESLNKRRIKMIKEKYQYSKNDIEMFADDEINYRANELIQLYMAQRDKSDLFNRDKEDFIEWASIRNELPKEKIAYLGNILYNTDDENEIFDKFVEDVFYKYQLLKKKPNNKSKVVKEALNNYRDQFGDYCTSEFLVLTEKLIDNITSEDVLTEENLYEKIYEEFDLRLIYDDDLWEVLKHYFRPTDPNLNYDTAQEDFANDIYNYIVANYDFDESEKEVEEESREVLKSEEPKKETVKLKKCK